MRTQEWCGFHRFVSIYGLPTNIESGLTPEDFAERLSNKVVVIHDQNTASAGLAWELGRTEIVITNRSRETPFLRTSQRSRGASVGGDLRQSSETSQSVIHGSLFAVYWIHQTLLDAVYDCAPGPSDSFWQLVCIRDWRPLYEAALLETTIHSRPCIAVNLSSLAHSSRD